MGDVVLKMKPSILITGAYGGMGKDTARLLADKGFFVFALDKSVGEKEENIFPIHRAKYPRLSTVISEKRLMRSLSVLPAE